METFVALVVPVAVISAVRGIWSPCGLSMLSSITPMAEAGRGNRFGVTATWFTIGGLVGGLSLGLITAAAAAGTAALGLDPSTRTGVAAAIAAVTAAIDLGITRVQLPIFKRQVNDAWLRTYRSWVYGAGFGWQIGFGVATYIITAGVFLLIALAVLSASPAVALAAGSTFGLVRGLAVFVGAPAKAPATLSRIHQALDRWDPASRVAAAAVQVVAAVALASAAFGPVAGVGVAAALGVAWALRRQVRVGRSGSAIVSS